MKIQIIMAVGILFAANAALSVPAHALTAKECGAKYQAAKKAGTLNGMKWNDFRKAECGAQASAAPAPGSSSASNTAAPAPAPNARAAAKPRAMTPAPAQSGNAVFPSAVSSKYANEPAGTARMHTCVDQYNANKATNANGGLKWTQRGGGYWSLCNKRLKGGAA